MTVAPGIGAEFAGYRIEALLGRGGVGLVYLAQDLTLPRRVALKILRAEYAVDPQFRERFVRESRLAASLDHLNIVPIFKAGEADGVLYIAMRYVDGTDLRRLLLEEGPLDIDRTLRILGQIGGALDAAHAQGLIHRDVKPANILVTPGVDGAADQAYLVDFGITKRTTTAGLTQAGLFVGTLDYAAPEQIRGQAVDGRTDVYSLGCVLFECLSGVSPFRRDSEIDTLQAHLSAPRPELSAIRPELGRAMDRVAMTAMAQNPDDRYGSGTALITAARAARPWTGVERRTRPHPSEPPPPLPPRPAPAPVRASAPPRRLPTPAPPPPAPVAPPPVRASTPPPPPPRPPRRAVPIAVAAAGVVLVAVAGLLALGHRGGEPAGAPASSSSSSPSPVPTRGLPGALLTLHDFAAASVTQVTSELRLDGVTCGAQATGEVDERNVAFEGVGDTARRGYFDAAASFPSEAEALAYVERLRAATQSCPYRLPHEPAAPALGDGTARVLFPSKAGTSPFVFDALYVRHGRVVSLVMVSGAGTEPPPHGDAEAFAQVVLRHIVDSGA